MNEKEGLCIEHPFQLGHNRQVQDRVVDIQLRVSKEGSYLNSNIYIKVTECPYYPYSYNENL